MFKCSLNSQVRRETLKLPEIKVELKHELKAHELGDRSTIALLVVVVLCIIKSF